MSELEDDLSAFASNDARVCLLGIKQAIRADSDYAWAWHSAIALTLYDGGLDHRHANAMAASLMIQIFDYDSTQSPRWRELFAFADGAT